MADESDPYVELPDEIDDDVSNGLMCFINMDRQCGHDCMAYTTQGSESPTLNDQQKNCVIVVGLERLGRYSGGLLKVVKNQIEDETRHRKSKPSE